jgi:alpha-L-rhamnosidase
LTALVTDLASSDGRIISPFQNYYLLRALARLGRAEVGLRVIRDYWGAMIDAGATTFWEVFDPRWVTSPSGIAEPPSPVGNTHRNLATDDYGGYRISLCHGWAAGPTAWLSNEVLGVRPTLPGFAALEVTPALGHLAWAEGSVPTPAGIVRVRHEQSVDGWLTRLSLPNIVPAIVRIPWVGAEPPVITVNGRETGNARWIDGASLVTIEGAGDWEIVARERA